jgi:NADPH:quinone reductase-like Zn-dependent oxidoreductase
MKDKAREVLTVGEMDALQPLAGEVRVRIAVSGVNPGDLKKPQNAFGVGMPYPRVMPHSDGAGTVDVVGEGVSQERLGRRMWCYGAQTDRPFGIAAESTVVPCWCKAVQERLVLAPLLWRIARERASSPLAVRKAIKSSSAFCATSTIKQRWMTNIGTGRIIHTTARRVTTAIRAFSLAQNLFGENE